MTERIDTRTMTVQHAAIFLGISPRDLPASLDRTGQMTGGDRHVFASDVEAHHAARFYEHGLPMHRVMRPKPTLQGPLPAPQRPGAPT